MDITHDNVCSSMLSCFYSHLLSTGRPISSFLSVCVNFLQKPKNTYVNYKEYMNQQKQQKQAKCQATQLAKVRLNFL